MARLNLTDLPPELLTEICSFLCCHCLELQSTVFSPVTAQSDPDHGQAQPRRADLLSLARVCRVLRGVAELFLYHSFHTSRTSDLYFFVRTLLDRPDLRLRVLDVDVGPSLVHAGDPLLARGRPEDAAELVESAEHAALISLLLQLVPNVESSHLHLPLFKAFPDLGRLESTHSPMLSLKRLAFTDLKRGFILDGTSPILRLAPNLEILRCHNCDDVSKVFLATLGRKMPSNPRPLQALAKLTLRNTSLTAASLLHLLEAVGPRLSKVDIRRSIGRQSRGYYQSLGEPKIEFNEVVTALQPWSHSLQELSFSMHEIDMILPRSPDHFAGVHLLREFRELRSLRTPADCLDFHGHLGRREDALAATLPPSIRELRLLGYSSIVPGLQGLARAFGAGQFAELQRIEVDHPAFEAGQLQLEAAREVREVAASFWPAGVDFVIHPKLGDFDSQ
ncbi:hypothetical protein C8A01DRAFT_14174 [Parachaetomium inaequale]|uniref:Uncharacterized protein n=1 Tax=Parachaetomium inaequale TaxID=2588326 RepID=A0AAN6PK32_9PEZI|nr:hypothetical protein C8A01DRAFT_14174 [Parachaetomium inaequale]